MFHSRRRLSRWAARVLLLWLFGIGAGFANACVATGVLPSAGQALDHRLAPHAHSKHGALAAGDVHHGSQDRADASAGGMDQAAQTANCQDFCDRSAISIPPLKSALDHADANGLPSQAEAMLFLAPNPELVLRWVPRRDGDLAPPITIAFLRLAL